MAYTTKEIKRLNRMNTPSQDIALGTTLNALVVGAVSASAHLVTSAEATASRVTMQTNLSAVNGYILMARQSGSAVRNIYSEVSGSNITMTSASPAYKIAANDIISYVAW